MPVNRYNDKPCTGAEAYTQIQLLFLWKQPFYKIY